jgi:uncharacterized iron-regulated membrane protein
MPAINLRKFHNKISPIIILPLLLSALSGVAYRIGRSWFGLSDQFGDLMMVIHQGEFLGKPLVSVYVLLVGLGLIAMIATGIAMWKQRQKTDQIRPNSEKFSPRLLHSFLAPVFFLPLFVSAFTGIIYRLGKSWFGLSDGQANLFMNIHQGNYLGTSLRAVYVLLVALGLLGMIVTGFQMMNIFRNRAARS